MRPLLCLLGLALWMLSASACGSRPAASSDTQDADTLTARTFELPEVPAVLTSPDDRLQFVVTHYWDRFDFRDTALIHLPDVTEQALVNYLDLLVRVDASVADSSFVRLFTSAREELVMYHYFAETVRHYLYEPNSPLRNEDLYAPAARYLAAHPEADLAAQSRASHDLKLIAMNRVGTPATDFPYTERGGRQGTLRTLRSAVPILVLFYNPDCESCQTQLARMTASEPLRRALQAKQLTLLAVYTEGDADIWREHAGELPLEWIDAQDARHRILDDELYDLTAMPTLYLLAADKTILLKDAQWEEVEDFLQKTEK